MNVRNRQAFLAFGKPADRRLDFVARQQEARGSRIGFDDSDAFHFGFENLIHRLFCRQTREILTVTADRNPFGNFPLPFSRPLAMALGEALFYQCRLDR